MSVGRWIILDFCETEKASMAKKPAILSHVFIYIPNYAKEVALGLKCTNLKMEFSIVCFW